MALRLRSATGRGRLGASIVRLKALGSGGFSSLGLEFAASQEEGNLSKPGPTSMHLIEDLCLIGLNPKP